VTTTPCREQPDAFETGDHRRLSAIAWRVTVCRRECPLLLQCAAYVDSLPAQALRGCVAAGRLFDEYGNEVDPAQYVYEANPERVSPELLDRLLSGETVHVADDGLPGVVYELAKHGVSDRTVTRLLGLRSWHVAQWIREKHSIPSSRSPSWLDESHANAQRVELALAGYRVRLCTAEAVVLTRRLRALGASDTEIAAVLTEVTGELWIRTRVRTLRFRSGIASRPVGDNRPELPEEIAS